MYPFAEVPLPLCPPPPTKIPPDLPMTDIVFNENYDLWHIFVWNKRRNKMCHKSNACHHCHGCILLRWLAVIVTLSGLFKNFHLSMNCNNCISFSDVKNVKLHEIHWFIMNHQKLLGLHWAMLTLKPVQKQTCRNAKERLVSRGPISEKVAICVWCNFARMATSNSINQSEIRIPAIVMEVVILTESLS